MRPHLLTVAALLLAALCYAAEFDGAGLALFFVAALLEVVFWIQTVQQPRHPPTRLIAPVKLRR